VLEAALEDLVNRCSSTRRKVNCPLIEALMQPEGRPS